MKTLIANHWRKKFAWLPVTIITPSPNGDEVAIRRVWLRCVFYKYVVWQGRYMGIAYSISDN